MNEHERNTVLVDFPPVREPFTGLVIAVRPGIDDLQDTRYLVLRWRKNGNRVFGRGKERICPRHESAFRAVWYSERFVRFINTSEEAVK